MSNEKSGIKKVVIKSDYTRKFPDPLNEDLMGENIEHYVLLCRAIDIPEDIPAEPNPRDRNINRAIYREVLRSLEDTNDLSFHLKNKGITILAHKVVLSQDKKVAMVYFSDGDGIVDGGHTHEIISKARRNGTCPDSQYVKLEIITGIPNCMRVDIAGGLNTTVKVEPKSLMNLEGRFDWIKDTLEDTSYSDKITYRENEDGVFDIRELIGILTLFNANIYSGTNHPKVAYTSKEICLRNYLKDIADEGPKTFLMLRPLLKNILELHDYVHDKGRIRYNAVCEGAAGKMKGVYREVKDNGGYHLHFIDEDVPQILYEATLYPILGAMRFLVEQKPGEDVYSWKFDSFEKVKAFYDEIAPELITATYNTSKDYGLKPNPIGKNENHWGNLYKTVGFHFVQNYAGKEGRA